MAADPLDLEAIVDGLISHQKAAGFFDHVLAHEPKSAPPEGVTAATWLNEGGPSTRSSGLASLSIRIEVITRIHNPMIAIDQDAIDRKVYRALAILLRAYAADFTLGGTVFSVDLKGAWGGPPLRWKAGYLPIDRQLLRVVDLFTPLIIADAFEEAP